MQRHTEVALGGTGSRVEKLQETILGLGFRGLGFTVV